MVQSKHFFLFQGTTQNLRMSMKETPKISFVVVAEEVIINPYHTNVENRMSS